MTKEEIKKAIEWGKGMIKAYKDANKPVPEEAYERMIELYEELMKEVR